MKSKKVAIFGCGPAGLIATHAARMMRYEVDVFSINQPSELYGCQYLHAPIRGVTSANPTTVSYNRIGTPEQYRTKVYGMGWKGAVSTSSLDSEHPAWDIREAYEILWFYYNQYIIDTKIDTSWLDDFQHADYEYVFSSVPAPTLCRDSRHKFKSMNVHAFGETPTRKIERNDFSIGNNQVLCNGMWMPSWYRISRVFGYGTIEWPEYETPDEGSSLVRKPLSTDCTCYLDIIRVGRYGRWEKGILTHHAMDQVQEVLHA